MTTVPARQQPGLPVQRRRPPIYATTIPIPTPGAELARDGDWVDGVQILYLGKDPRGRERRSFTGPEASVGRCIERVRNAGVLQSCTDPVTDPHRVGWVRVVVTYFEVVREGARWTQQRTRWSTGRKVALVISCLPLVPVAAGLVWLWCAIHPLAACATFGALIWLCGLAVKRYHHWLQHRTSNISHVGVDHVDNGRHQ